MDLDRNVVVVGAGLGGSMAALLLARRGMQVRILEKRDDMRQSDGAHSSTSSAVLVSHEDHQEVPAMGQLTDTAKRSINLALSHRGIAALKACGLMERVRPLLIPMKGRSVHDLRGHVSFQPYGKDHQAIYSVPRFALNVFLLDELEQLENVEVFFSHRVVRVKPDGKLVVKNQNTGQTVEAAPSLTIGADGAFSAVRDSLAKCSRLDFSQTFLASGYKELVIQPTPEGEFALQEYNSLHIWPRHGFMLIALPNPDKSFTVTLFAPWKGPQGLEALNTDDKIIDYFKNHFPDVIQVMPDYLEQFKQNPSSPLLTVRCSPWNHFDKVVLLADAAHAVVPFYGQGMNAAFEDALLLDELLESNNCDIPQTLKEFDSQRRPACNALATLSLHNYVEMSSLTTKPWFVLKKKLEALIHSVVPSLWIPLYSMVSFSRVPYDEAIRRAQIQDRVLASVGIAALAALAAAGGVQLKRR